MPHLNVGHTKLVQLGKKGNTMFDDMKPESMFATPESKNALQDYLLAFSGSERTIALTSAMMMYNYIVTNYEVTPK